jgi:SLOG family YspA-like protein
VSLRVLVTGSQTWADVAAVDTALAGVWHDFGRPTAPVLVSGHCPRGGDAIAEMCWRRRGFEVEEHSARWREHGDDCPAWHAGLDVCLKAGFRRDAEMVASGAHVCVALIAACVNPKCKRIEPHGSHGASGTAAMAARAGIEVRPVTVGF